MTFNSPLQSPSPTLACSRNLQTTCVPLHLEYKSSEELINILHIYFSNICHLTDQIRADYLASLSCATRNLYTPKHPNSHINNGTPTREFSIQTRLYPKAMPCADPFLHEPHKNLYYCHFNSMQDVRSWNWQPHPITILQKGNAGSLPSRSRSPSAYRTWTGATPCSNRSQTTQN